MTLWAVSYVKVYKCAHSVKHQKVISQQMMENAKRSQKRKIVPLQKKKTARSHAKEISATKEIYIGLSV